MRVTLVSMIVVALLAAGVCIFSVGMIGRTVDEMEEMRTEVLEMVDSGDVSGAYDRLQQMEDAWHEKENLLAVLAPHDSLHEIAGLIIEGSANLEADDLDDFNRSMELLSEALHHLQTEERLSLANIL